MINGLLARKIGMTQLFNEDGSAVPVTILEAGPCVVVQRKTVERDGYDAVKVGFVEKKPYRKARKPEVGQFKAAGVPPTRVLREFKVAEGADVKPGDSITCDLLQAGEIVDVIGRGKGRGFQGVIKRHGHGGGRATHGSMFHRGPGSIGQSAWPAKVFKGVKLPGQMGNKRITTKGIEVIEVDAEKNIVAVRGSVPGAKGSLVTIRRYKSEAPHLEQKAAEAAAEAEAPQEASE